MRTVAKDMIDISHVDAVNVWMGCINTWWGSWWYHGYRTMYVVEIQGINFYSPRRNIEIFDRNTVMYTFEPDYSFTYKKLKGLHEKKFEGLQRR